MSYVFGECFCGQITLVQVGDLFIRCPKCEMKVHLDYDEVTDENSFETIKEAIADLTPRQKKNYARYKKFYSVEE